MAENTKKRYLFEVDYQGDRVQLHFYMSIRKRARLAARISISEWLGSTVVVDALWIRAGWHRRGLERAAVRKLAEFAQSEEGIERVDAWLRVEEHANWKAAFRREGWRPVELGRSEWLLSRTFGVTK